MKKDLNYYVNLPYKVCLYPDPAGGFAVELPDLPGCISQGDNDEDAYEMIQDAKLCWIETALEDGFEIPEPGEIKKGSFLEQLNGLLEKYEFRAVLGNSGAGTIMGKLEGFDLIIETDTEESAIEKLAEELLDYANDYVRDFHRYFNSTNRKAHFPYVLKVLLSRDINQITGMIKEVK
jgi:predicted RNase H-like HicB family nuclease